MERALNPTGSISQCVGKANNFLKTWLTGTLGFSQWYTIFSSVYNRAQAQRKNAMHYIVQNNINMSQYLQASYHAR